MNAWEALSKIFASMLADPCLQSTYVIIDALDECSTDLDLLLDLIVDKSAAYPNIKWIVSSRNWPVIEKAFNKAIQKVRLCLELNEKSVSAAVTTYIEVKVKRLAEVNHFSPEVKTTIQDHLLSNARDTFLWVALVCQALAGTSEWEIEDTLSEFPPGLDSLYDRMIRQISKSKHAVLCRRLLACVSTVYRPITLDELPSLVEMPPQCSGNDKYLVEIIELCGSFLTVRDRTVLFVHQSAKDFLLEKAFDYVFPLGMSSIHHNLFSRSISIMSQTLQRDMYDLKHPGFPIKEVKQPERDPLAPAYYSCVNWVDHLVAVTDSVQLEHDLADEGIVHGFLRESYLHWLEALSLLRSIPQGALSLAQLERLLQVCPCHSMSYKSQI